MGKARRGVGRAGCAACRAEPGVLRMLQAWLVEANTYLYE